MNLFFLFMKSITRKFNFMGLFDIRFVAWKHCEPRPGVMIYYKSNCTQIRNQPIRSSIYRPGFLPISSHCHWALYHGSLEKKDKFCILLLNFPKQNVTKFQPNLKQENMLKQRIIWKKRKTKPIFAPKKTRLLPFKIATTNRPQNNSETITFDGLFSISIAEERRENITGKMMEIKF